MGNRLLQSSPFIEILMRLSCFFLNFLDRQAFQTGNETAAMQALWRASWLDERRMFFERFKTTLCHYTANVFIETLFSRIPFTMFFFHLKVLLTINTLCVEILQRSHVLYIHIYIIYVTVNSTHFLLHSQGLFLFCCLDRPWVNWCEINKAGDEIRMETHGFKVGFE